MNHYEARQQARRERLERIAEKLEREGNARYARARQLAAAIPFGQPILVGHHSERRDRNYRTRIHTTFGKAFEQLKAAGEYSARAAAVGAGGVSSDDPDAIAKLRQQLEEHEARRARMLAVNKAHARWLKKPATLEAAELSESDKATIRNYKPAYSWEPHPFAPFELTNLGANIRRIKQRIAALEKQHAYAAAFGAEIREHACNGYTVREAFGLNRVQVVFPGKPAAAVRDVLKRQGFRWSPTEQAWQRMHSPGLVAWLTQPDGHVRREIERALG